MKTAFRFLITCILTVSLFFGQSLSSEESPNSKELENLLTIDYHKYIENFYIDAVSKYKVPGMLVVTVDNGEIKHLNGYGYANLEKKQEFHIENTYISLDSISRLFVVLSILQLQEIESLNLYSPYNRYTQLPIQSMNSKKPITISQLLSFTDGLEDKEILSWTDSLSKLKSYNHWLKENQPTNFMQTDEHVSYNSTSALILAKIVEDITNQRYEIYVKEKILKSIHLEKTHFYNQINPNEILLDKKYNFIDQHIPIQDIYPILSPHNGMISTARDISSLMVHLLRGLDETDVQSLLSPSMIKKIFHGQKNSNQYLLKTTLGMFEHFRNGINFYVLDGEFHGSSIRLLLIPQRKQGFFIYANTESAKFLDDFTSRFLNHFYPYSKTELIPDDSADTFLRMLSYQGYYNFVHYSRNSIAKLKRFNNEIFVKTNRDGTITVGAGSDKYGNLIGINNFTEIEPLYFRAVDQEKYIEFKVDNIGNVTHLVSGDGFFGTYEKLKWFDQIVFHKTLIALFFLYFSSILLLLMGNSFTLKFIFDQKLKLNLINLLKFLFIIQSFVNLSFVSWISYYVFFLAKSNPSFHESFLLDMPQLTNIIFILPYTSIFLFCIILYLLIRAYYEKLLSISRIVKYSIYISVSFFYIFWINYWNLYGF